MHAADPDAKMIAYDWAWCRTWTDPDKNEFKLRVLDLLPRSIYVCSVSEQGMMTHVGGVEQAVADYSISQVGPSPISIKTWAHARKLGMGITAKVQINNSWELSAVPYIPVPYLIDEHLNRLKKEGVSSLMLSWTLGGFPGGNLNLLTASPEEIASAKFHPSLAEKVCGAWKCFSESFRQFPFNIGTLYTAPMNFGPMNLLYLKETSWRASMVGFPYDDIKSWRGPYPEEIFLQQFRILTDGWKQGLDILAQAEPEVHAEERADFTDLYDVAQAAYCHFRSTCLQVRFVMARNHGFDRPAMAECLREEIRIAKKLHAIVRRDSRIGFEASNHYFYTLGDLREKVISCAHLLQELA